MSLVYCSVQNSSREPQPLLTRSRVLVEASRIGYGLYEGSSALQGGVANTEIHRNVATVQFGAGIDVRTRLKLPFPIGLRGDFWNFYTLGTPVSAFRFSAQNRTA